jgi:hypothetical protein
VAESIGKRFAERSLMMSASYIQHSERALSNQDDLLNSSLDSYSNADRLSFKENDKADALFNATMPI